MRISDAKRMERLAKWKALIDSQKVAECRSELGVSAMI